ncbi:protein-disulfide reductase DsbD family protein [Shewanella maritima]|uniref:protein-disulfide reductase DsbD family protein n=1 Tax=Shewanella maritima TaxID=2520507 RepID=UPI00373646BE
MLSLFWLPVNLVWAQSTAIGDHIEVALVAEHQQLSPEKTNWIGVLLSPEEHWHTYWQNPGDSGEAPSVDWSASANLTFGDILWPIPQQIPVAHLVNYGYEGQVLLMVPVEFAHSQAADKQVEINVSLSWLVCKEDCIPGWADLSITLPVVQAKQLSAHASLFAQTREQLPNETQLTAKFEVTEQHLTLSYQPPYQSEWQLLPLRSDIVQHNEKQTVINEGNVNHQVIGLSDYFTADADELAFLMTDGQSGYYITASLNDTQIETSHTLLMLLLMAFIGGLVLNIMPCVLPVLSFKAMSLGHAQMSLSQKLGYGLGVLVCFNVFASVIIALKASGEAVGWGFHMQEPAVIAFLAYLFVFIALILMDVAPSGARLAGLGQSLIAGNGFGSQFFTGVLAVVVASPCTAPFMAAALGVALVSPPLTTYLIFTALAMGFALPLTLLFVSNRFAKLLPKPGAWMDTFKQLLVFPMLATVVWLVWVYLGQTGALEQFGLLMSLVGFALLIWLSSKIKQVYGLLALILAIVLLVTSLLNSTNATAVNTNSTHESFSPEKLAQLRNKNQLVLVNMTADWCITCKVNEQVAFSTPQVKDALAQHNVHYLVGDWTNKNDTIFNYLKQFQRSGVPLYVMYAGNDYEQVLPQILTPETVVGAINTAKKEVNND